MDKRSIENVVAMSPSIVSEVGREAQHRLMRTGPTGLSGPITESVLQFQINSVVCVPPATRDRTIGVIYLDTANPQRFFE
jgi:hypothetical protein